MLILALDCCGSSCAVGLWQDGAMLAQAQETMARGQDARLMPMVVDVMRAIGGDFSRLDKIAVTRGPGSFTGTRVGLAAARGLGLAAGKPVIGIDRFDAYQILCAEAGKNLLVVIESKRADLFCKYFPVGGAAHEPQLLANAQIEEFVAAHPDTVIAGDQHVHDIGILAVCAEIAATADADDEKWAPRPLYLRAPDVSFPKTR